MYLENAHHGVGNLFIGRPIRRCFVLLHIPRGQSSNPIVATSVEQYNRDAPAFEANRFIASEQTQVFFNFSLVKERQHHFALHASVGDKEGFFEGFYTGSGAQNIKQCRQKGVMRTFSVRK